MPAGDRVLGHAPAVQPDDLDDLFDYNVSTTIFQDVDTNIEGPAKPQRTLARSREEDNAGGLGLDEVIKVTKKRVPAVKLDEHRFV